MTADNDERLVDQAYWEGIYKGDAPRAAPRAAREYQYAVFWDDIVAKLITPQPGAKVIEIGSAPGNRVVEFARDYGFEPYGLEYTSAGVRQNKALFEAEGYSADNVVQADLFDDDAVTPLRGKFDYVVSFGFIEHFTDPVPAVLRHADLCKPGGMVIVTIPNMRGVNRWLMRWFDPALEPLHNFEIMKLEAFRRLFPADRFEPLHVGYIGGYSFIFRDTATGLRRFVQLALMNMQPLLHAVMGKFRPRHFESALFSPSIAFVGRVR